MAIDYTKEYDNRARVPEHPEIFKRWAGEAAAYRQASPKARLNLAYGPTPKQGIDLFPAGEADAPLAMFIHGGWWRSFDRSDYSHMAKGLNAHGVSVAVVGYDLAPHVSIAQITEQVRAAALYLWRDQKKHFVAYGHSAGGHLSACLVATDWETLDPAAPTDLVPTGYGISGVYDTTKLLTTPLNSDLKLTEETARACSPLFWPVPSGRTFDAVVGGSESSEFLRQSRDFAEAWRQDNVETRYEAFDGANHFTVLDPLTDADSAMTKRVVELARQTALFDR